MKVRFAVNDNGWTEWEDANVSVLSNVLHIENHDPWHEGVSFDDLDFDIEHNVFWTLYDGAYHLVQLAGEPK